MDNLVFVLDDDDYIRNLVEKFLVFEGFEVETFNTSNSLLLRLEKKQPDCFVLDVMLPDINGFNLCR
jgi:DNA-binding response OmpR family regulator